MAPARRLARSPTAALSHAAQTTYNFRSGVKDSSTILNPGSDAWVPRVATLDGFADETADLPGVDLRDVEPLTTITIRTRNSQYRIIVTLGTSVVVQGGRFFPDAIAARVDGSGFGGSLLKVGWIGIGLQMEIFAGDQRIITSPVYDISIEPRAAGTAH